jgi:succinate dehydrogenase / fumarate reductase, cytochrome b subunit
MADAATTAAVHTDTGTRDDHSFLWRRLHSLSGVLPLGAFLCYHVFENLSALRGPAAYNEMVNDVNTLLPRTFFFGLELVTIVLPLAFHALYGVWVAATGRPNVGRYAYASNWAYLAQRITGSIALLFLLVHVGTLRTWVTLLGNHLAPVPPVTADGLDLVTYRDVAAHLGNPASLGVQSILAGDHIFALYIVGTLCTIWHFTYGLKGFCWTWGIAVGRVAQRRVTVVSWLLFAVLSVATLSILFQMRFGAVG